MKKKILIVLFILSFFYILWPFLKAIQLTFFETNSISDCLTDL